MASTSDYIKSMYLDPKDDDNQYLTKKRKKKSRAADVKNIKIYDDDINLVEIKKTEDDEKYEPKEDKPAIDENFKDISKLVKSRSSWKTIEIKKTEKYKKLDSDKSDDYDLTKSRDTRRRRNENDKKLDSGQSDDYDLTESRDTRRRKNENNKKLDSDQSDDYDLTESRDTRRRRNENNKKLDSDQSDDYDLTNSRDIRRKRDNENNSHYRRHRSRDKSPRIIKKKEIKRKDSVEDRRRRRIRQSSESDNDHQHYKKKKSRRSAESDSSHHHLKKSKHKSKDKSPKVIKINEIRNSSDEDIREKIKNLYKEDGPDLEKLKEKNEIDQKYKKWSRGLKQIDDKKRQLEEEEYKMSKPLARYKDDEDLDKHLRDQELIDDPMLEYFRKRKKEKDQEKQLKETGEVWAIPKYESKFPPPINRYNILPGYRWDGVDRSNGFEIRLLNKKAERQANEEEAYKYGSLDM